MCGIFGWSYRPGRLPPAERRAVFATVLGLLNESRGRHAWGAYTPGYEVTRGLGGIGENMLSLRMRDSAMCHTRFATTGRPDDVNNAHPFVIGNIVGAHNGVIDNHDELNTKFNRSHAVDSMHIFDHMDSKLPLLDLEGYGAIEFSELDDISINLGLLTASGSLAALRIDHGVVWSSDEDHLAAACRVAGYSVKGEYELSAGEVISVVAGRAFESPKKVRISASVTKTPAGWGGHYSHDFEDWYNEPMGFRYADLFKSEK